MKTVLTVLLSALISIGAVLLLHPRHEQFPQKEVTVGFTRVMASNTLRCGYQYWDGGLMKNEKTGQLEGFMVDVTNEIARLNNLKVEWVGPIDWSNFATDLNSGKIDAFCAGSWLAGKYAKAMLVSDPVTYNGFEAFVRDNDHRFDGDPSSLDRPDVTVAILGNTSSGFISQRALPHAKAYDLSASATDMDLILNVATKKADVAFTSPGIVYQYMLHNPGQVRRLRPDMPYALMGVSYELDGDDFRLWHLINVSLMELKNTNVIKSLVEKYNAQYPGLFIYH